MLESRAARTTRGMIAAVVATVVAVASHSIADGRLAPLLGLVLALTVAVPLRVALAGRSLSWLRLSVAVSLSQFVFHGLLLVGVGEGSGSAAAATAEHAMTGHTMVELGATSVSSGAMHHAGPWMWVAHAIAAVVTVLAIGRGEQALRALLALTGWELLARLVDWTPDPIAGRRLPAPRGIVLPAASVAVLRAVRRRGPPVTA